MKKVIVIIDFPGLSQQQYDLVIKDMGSSGTLKQKRRMHHFAGPKKNGWLVVDVWESADAFKDFSKILIPTLRKFDIPLIEPEIYHLHNEIH